MIVLRYLVAAAIVLCKPPVAAFTAVLRLIPAGVSATARFLAPVAGSINGALIPNEIGKAAVAALAASSVAGGISAALAVFAADAPALFTSPAAAALVTWILTNCAMQWRFLSQGKPLAQAVPPHFDHLPAYEAFRSELLARASAEGPAGGPALMVPRFEVCEANGFIRPPTEAEVSCVCRSGGIASFHPRTFNGTEGARILIDIESFPTSVRNPAAGA